MFRGDLNSSPSFDDFDNQFEQRRREIDATFRAIQRRGLYLGIASLTGSVVCLGFIGWVIVKCMAHFGVL